MLRHNLQAIRHAIDDYRADHGNNPESLGALVTDKYLRELPMDPVTGRRDSWLPQTGEAPGVNDVVSGAQGRGLDGLDYAGW
ncbi:Bacterial type II secretion system protein G [compost metagenome]